VIFALLGIDDKYFVIQIRLIKLVSTNYLQKSNQSYPYEKIELFKNDYGKVPEFIDNSEFLKTFRIHFWKIFLMKLLNFCKNNSKRKSQI